MAGGDKYWVGFDLGGTKMLAVIYDNKLKPVARKRRKTKAQLGAGNGVERMVRTIRDAVEETGLDTAVIKGIGIGVPGPLDPERGIVHDLPNLGWKDVALAEELQAALGVPTFLVNDVDAGVYGEFTGGAAKGARCVLGVFPGTGIGGGCVYDGQILRGRHLTCMEIGHIRVQPDGPLCGCGNRGCLEAVASRLAISAAASAAAYRGEAPYLLEHAGMDLSNIRSGMLEAAIRAGDESVEHIVREAARWLGVGVASVINLLAPEVVVLGGGLVEAMPTIYLKGTRRAVADYVMPVFRDTYKIVTAALGDDAATLGAAAWARHETA